MLREDSHSPKTLEKVKAILKGKKLDFLFIDGDHTYEGVKKDFEMYSKLVERESNSFTRHTLPSKMSRMSSRQILEGNKAILQNRRDNSIENLRVGRNRNNICLIAFHDILLGPEENVGGVPKFWREIKAHYKYLEIVKDWKQKGYGIGVIFIT